MSNQPLPADNDLSVNRAETHSYVQHSYVTDRGEPVCIGENRHTVQGQSRLVSETSRLDHSQHRIISERVVEHEVVVPKKIVREDVVEKVVVVPERIVHEEMTEEIQKIREKVIEIAVPVVQERVVEVPEIEYVEKVVEIPEIVIQERVTEVPRVEIKERVIEVPKIITQEKVIEVPEIEYREVPVERVVEVPEVREQVVVKEIPVPQYVEKPVPEYVDVHQEKDIERFIPVAVEAVTTCEFQLPKLKPKYVKVDVPLYVPRFVEVPVAKDSMTRSSIAQAEHFANQVASIASQQAVSLCTVETLAHEIKSANLEQSLTASDVNATVAEHWNAGRLQVDRVAMTPSTIVASN